MTTPETDLTTAGTDATAAGADAATAGTDGTDGTAAGTDAATAATAATAGTAAGTDAATTGTDGTAAGTDAATAVRALIEEHAAAMRAADAGRLAACHRPGAEVFDLAPPLRKTFDVEGMRAWFAGHGGGPLGYEIRDLAVTAGPDVAYAHCLSRMYAPGFELWFRASYGLRREGGRWLIAHVHESTPFHMDGSMAAAVDLTP